MKALAFLIGLSLVSYGCRPREQPSAPAPVDSSTGAAPAASGLLYAQRTAEIHFQSPSGPVIGRVHPGARVEVAPADAGQVRIVLPAVFTGDKRNEQLVALVDNDAFSPTPRPLAAVTFPAGSRVVKDANKLDLGATPATPGDHSPFATTLCGEVHILSSGDTSPALVAQVHAGIEISGWIDDARDVHRGLLRCGTRRVVRKGEKLLLLGGATGEDSSEIASVPPSFIGDELGEVDDLAARIAEAGPLYWLVGTPGATTVCREWKFAHLPDKTWALIRIAPLTTEGQLAFASFGASYARPSLLLAGPHFTKQPLDKAPSSPVVGGYRCAIGYSFVGTRDGALRMSVAGAPEGTTLVAWHPDDEERWYLTAAACDAARVRADEALQKDHDATTPGGVHVDCFDELSEK